MERMYCHQSKLYQHGITIALKALDHAFGVKKVFAVSLQALSGGDTQASLH